MSNDSLRRAAASREAQRERVHDSYFGTLPQRKIFGRLILDDRERGRFHIEEAPAFTIGRRPILFEQEHEAAARPGRLRLRLPVNDEPGSYGSERNETIAGVVSITLAILLIVLLGLFALAHKDLLTEIQLAVGL